MRKFVCAAVVVVCHFSVAVADEFFVAIKKIDGGKIEGTKKAKAKGEEGEKVTLTLAKDAKVVVGKFNKDTKKVEAGDAYEGGLTALTEKASKAEKGVGAMVVTDGDGKVTEIRVTGGKKKKKGA